MVPESERARSLPLWEDYADLFFFLARRKSVTKKRNEPSREEVSMVSAGVEVTSLTIVSSHSLFAAAARQGNAAQPNVITVGR